MENITKSLGQNFYELFGEPNPFIRADLHLIKKRAPDKAKEAVSAAVNEERNIDVEDEAKEEPPKKLTPEEVAKKDKDKELADAYYYKKMNKTASAKHTEKKEAQAEAEKIKRRACKSSRENSKVKGKGRERCKERGCMGETNNRTHV